MYPDKKMSFPMGIYPITVMVQVMNFAKTAFFFDVVRIGYDDFIAYTLTHKMSNGKINIINQCLMCK